MLTTLSRDLLILEQPRLNDGFASLTEMAKQNIPLTGQELIVAETRRDQALAPSTPAQLDRLMSACDGVPRDRPDIIPDPGKQLEIMRLKLSMYPHPIAEAGLKLALAKASPL